MQRQLKFRYWNTVSNMMVTDPALPVKEMSLEEYFSERGWTWMQATGLKDKNGKEIYEGDVVRIHPALQEDEEKERGKRYFVEYLGSSWMLTSEIGSWSNVSGGAAWWSAQVEVIGNIYENADLLK